MTVALPDTGGLICAFYLDPPRACGWEALDAASGTPSPLWLHFNLTDTRARRWIETRGELPDSAREELVNPDARVHAQALPEGLVVVLADLHHDFHADPEGVGTLHVYVDPHRMISGRRHPLRSVDHLRRGLLGGLVVDSPLALLENLILAIAESFGGVVGRLSDEVDDAEDLILAGRLHEQGTTLGRIRRLLARLRRHVGANRSALASMLSHLPAWCDAENRHRLRQAVDHMEVVTQDIELVQERTRLLQEEIAGRLTEATNRNLFLLSILTATFLPVTMITGVFGMNVGGLPWLNDPSGFWWVCGAMIAGVVTALLLLRRWRIF
jgi:zinc transporter